MTLIPIYCIVGRDYSARHQQVLQNLNSDYNIRVDLKLN